MRYKCTRTDDGQCLGRKAACSCPWQRENPLCDSGTQHPAVATLPQLRTLYSWEKQRLLKIRGRSGVLKTCCAGRRPQGLSQRTQKGPGGPAMAIHPVDSHPLVTSCLAKPQMLQMGLENRAITCLAPHPQFSPWFIPIQQEPEEPTSLKSGSSRLQSPTSPLAAQTQPAASRSGRTEGWWRCVKEIKRSEESQRAPLHTVLSILCVQGWMDEVSSAVGPSSTEWNRHRM